MLLSNVLENYGGTPEQLAEYIRKDTRFRLLDEVDSLTVVERVG